MDLSANGVHISAGMIGTCREVLSIRREIKKLNAAVKELREREKPLKQLIYDFMSKRALPKIVVQKPTGASPAGEITLRSVSPKTKRKTIKEKKRDAFDFFRQNGIDNAEFFWSEFQQTQKTNARDQNSSEETDDREVYED